MIWPGISLTTWPSAPSKKYWLSICLLSTLDWSSASNQPLEPTLVEISVVLAQINNLIDREIKQTDQPWQWQSILAIAQSILKNPNGGVLLRPAIIVLVEGQSELIVLPHFARLSGKPLEELGAMVIASGGAQQVARRYLTMRDVLKIPIVCVFDGDAEASSMIIEESLRDCDGLICLESTELEDCYSHEQLLKILNWQLLKIGQTLSSENFSIPKIGPRKNALNKLFRSLGLGDFDKIEFAKSTVALTSGKNDVPAEMNKVIDFVSKIKARFMGVK